MLYSAALIAFLATTSINAIPIPLNINLGAFSPALVVGDGEISFGGEADVTQLMTALSGASQEAKTNSAATVQAAGIDSAIVSPAEAVTSASEPEPIVDDGPIIEPISTPTIVPVPVASLPDGLTGIGREVIEPRADVPVLAKRDVTTEIETRDVPQLEARDDVSAQEKRDLAGFNAALAFAANALKTGPEVQLGTGEGGSGVGIIVKAGGAPSTAGEAKPAAEAAKPATEAAKPAAEKREVTKRTLPTVTMLKIRTVGDSTVSKARRSLESRVDAEDEEEINLNVGGDGQAYELTIAEVKP